MHLNSYIGLVRDFLICTMLLKMDFTAASFNALRFSLSGVKIILVFFFFFSESGFSQLPRLAQPQVIAEFHRRVSGAP